MRVAWVGVGAAPHRAPALEEALGGAQAADWPRLVDSNVGMLRLTPNVVWGGPHLRKVAPHLLKRALQSLSHPEWHGRGEVGLHDWISERTES